MQYCGFSCTHLILTATMQKLLLLLSVVTLFTGCDFLMKKPGPSLPSSEKIVLTDGPAPVGYTPIYLNKIQPLSADTALDPMVHISRMEVSATKVKVYLQIMDSSGIYLNQGTAAQWKKIWCVVEETMNGKTKPVTNYTLRELNEDDRQPTAIAIVMDHSGSMGDERARAVQAAAAEFIKRKKPEDAICLIKFDNHIVTECPLTTDANQLLTQLKLTGLDGFGYTTAVYDGTWEGVTAVKDASGYQRKAVITFTDGVDNNSTHTPDEVGQYARQNGVLICAVDYGLYTKKGAMQSMAAPSGGSHSQMYFKEEFDDVYTDIYRRLRNSYVLEYKPSTYGPHTLHLVLCLPQGKTEASAEYDNTPEPGDIALLNVFFDINLATLKPESQEAIDNVVAIMTNFPNMTIELRGHTDNTGDKTFNQTLSQQRADAVKAALVARGIAAERISTKGFGPDSPIETNDTVEGRAKNRRTEFVILTK